MGRRRVVVLSTIAVAFAGALLFLVVRYIAQHPEAANLGARVIKLDADRNAETIRRTGPYPLEDPDDKRNRDVYLQHVGGDPETGWIIVLAYPPDSTCAVTWDTRRHVFEDPCSKRTYPADGSGLTTYPAPVENGRVVIDLRGG